MSVVGEHIEAVVFDFDDTLVGTIEAKWAAHKHIALTHYGKKLTDEEIRQHWGKPLHILVGLLYGDDNIERAMAHEQATHRTFPKKLLDDTLDVLEHYHQIGKRLGLVTAASRASLVTDFEVAGIPPELFDYTQTQDDTAFHKPDPRVFEPLINWLGTVSILPGETLYVGDGLHDMKAALGAGFEFIGVTSGLVTQAEFEANGHKPITTLRELL